MDAPDRNECLQEARTWVQRWAKAEVSYFRRLLGAARTGCPRQCGRVAQADDLANDFKELAAEWLARLSASGMDATARDLARESAEWLARGRFDVCRDFNRPADVALAIPLASEEWREASPEPGLN